MNSEITKQCLTVTLKLSTAPTVISSAYLPDHTFIHFLVLDVTSLVFNIFPATCTVLYAKLQYSLTNMIVLVVCYVIAKTHFTRYSELRPPEQGL